MKERITLMETPKVNAEETILVRRLLKFSKTKPLWSEFRFNGVSSL